MKKRAIIPIDFDEKTVKKLTAEAKEIGLSRAAYLRHLIVTHPTRNKK